METEIYETGILTFTQATKFLMWFNDQIGTECETDNEGAGKYYIVCSELTPDEVKRCRKAENMIKGEG